MSNARNTTVTINAEVHYAVCADGIFNIIAETGVVFGNPNVAALRAEVGMSVSQFVEIAKAAKAAYIAANS